MAPGTELNSMLAGKVEEMTAETGDRLRVSGSCALVLCVSLIIVM
jgi:hypothetical protein